VAYENLIIRILPLIPKGGWSFFVKITSFAHQAKFGKSFYVSLAAFLKFDFHETIAGSVDWIFVRGRCIEYVVSSHKQLLTLSWIIETSPKMTKAYPWIYLDILKLYGTKNFLDEASDVIERMSLQKEDQSPEITNFSIGLTKLFPQETLAPYFESWQSFMAKKHRFGYAKLMKYHLFTF
jgi:hypothetical protein